MVFMAHITRSVRFVVFVLFFFQAEDGIRDLVRSRGLGDVYKRQSEYTIRTIAPRLPFADRSWTQKKNLGSAWLWYGCCLLYTSDAADERSSVDLGGRRIIKKKNNENLDTLCMVTIKERISAY